MFAINIKRNNMRIAFEKINKLHLQIISDLSYYIKNDNQLISRSLEDVLVEPVRSILIPKFDELKQKSKELGALGGGISGSGPSIFMLSETKEIADKVAEIMQKIYNEIGIENFVYVSKINDQGIRIV